MHRHAPQAQEKDHDVTRIDVDGLSGAGLGGSGWRFLWLADVLALRARKPLRPRVCSGRVRAGLPTSLPPGSRLLRADVLPAGLLPADLLHAVLLGIAAGCGDSRCASRAGSAASGR